LPDSFSLLELASDETALGIVRESSTPDWMVVIVISWGSGTGARSASIIAQLRAILGDLWEA
jgi:hypothetical protein